MLSVVSANTAHVLKLVARSAHQTLLCTEVLCPFRTRTPVCERGKTLRSPSATRFSSRYSWHTDICRVSSRPVGSPRTCSLSVTVELRDSQSEAPAPPAHVAPHSSAIRRGSNRLAGFVKADEHPSVAVSLSTPETGTPCVGRFAFCGPGHADAAVRISESFAASCQPSASGPALRHDTNRGEKPVRVDRFDQMR
jgi:hypothetical protein